MNVFSEDISYAHVYQQCLFVTSYLITSFFSAGDHLQCYRSDAKDIAKNGIRAFWKSFGYLSDDWTVPPSSEIKYVRQRASKIPKTIQCG